MEKNEFKDKKVLVTGSSKGIGFDIGKTFLESGAKVLFTGTTPVPNYLINDNAFYLAGDLTNEKDLVKLFSYTQSIFNNKLDVLICNIGGGNMPIKLKYTKIEWEKNFNLNFFSTMYTIQKFVDLLKNSKNPSNSL